MKTPPREVVLCTKTCHVCTSTGSTDHAQTASCSVLPSPSPHASGSAGQRLIQFSPPPPKSIHSDPDSWHWIQTHNPDGNAVELFTLRILPMLPCNAASATWSWSCPVSPKFYFAPRCHACTEINTYTYTLSDTHTLSDTPTHSLIHTHTL